jgi:hypothetical protein
VACNQTSRCTFIDMRALGGDVSLNNVPKTQMWHDPSHLNEFGYCTLINDFKMQYALGCNLLKRATYDCTDQSAWIPWTIGAAGVVVIAGISVLVVTLTGEDDETMAVVSDADQEKDLVGKNIDQVENMSADFDQFNAISNMKTSIPSSFGQHL